VHTPINTNNANNDLVIDDDRAALSQAMLDDPIGVMSAIMDAEAAEDAETAAALDEIERLFADYDKRKQARRRKEWPRDCQPYCLVRRADGAWTWSAANTSGLARCNRQRLHGATGTPPATLVGNSNAATRSRYSAARSKGAYGASLRAFGAAIAFICRSTSTIIVRALGG
jgi:hypothetical protein